MVGQRVLDGLADLLLRLVQTADVGPGDVRDLEHHLAHRGRPDVAERIAEVAGLDQELLEFLLRELVLLEVEVRELPPEGPYPGLAGERRKVGTDEPVGLLRDLLEVDVVAERHGPGVDLQDLDPVLLGRHADLDLAVEPSGAAEGRVDGVDTVRSADDHDLARAPRARPSWSGAGATTRRSTSPVTSSRLGAIESSSSMKMIAGAFSRASSKTSRRRCSDSP